MKGERRRRRSANCARRHNMHPDERHVYQASTHTIDTNYCNPLRKKNTASVLQSFHSQSAKQLKSTRDTANGHPRNASEIRVVPWLSVCVCVYCEMVTLPCADSLTQCMRPPLYRDVYTPRPVTINPQRCTKHWTNTHKHIHSKKYPQRTHITHTYYIIAKVHTHAASKDRPSSARANRTRGAFAVCMMLWMNHIV